MHRQNYAKRQLYSEEISFWSSEDEIETGLYKGFTYENEKPYIWLIPFDLLTILIGLALKGENMRFCLTVKGRRFWGPASCFDIFVLLCFATSTMEQLSAVTSFSCILRHFLWNHNCNVLARLQKKNFPEENTLTLVGLIIFPHRVSSFIYLSALLGFKVKH